MRVATHGQDLVSAEYINADWELRSLGGPQNMCS